MPITVGPTTRRHIALAALVALALFIAYSATQDTTPAQPLTSDRPAASTAESTNLVKGAYARSASNDAGLSKIFGSTATEAAWAPIRYSANPGLSLALSARYPSYPDAVRGQSQRDVQTASCCGRQRAARLTAPWDPSIPDGCRRL